MPKSLGAALNCEGLAIRHLSHYLVGQGKAVAGDLRNIPRYVLRALIGLIALCGLVNLWGSHGDGKMPSVAPLFGLDPYRISSADCIDDGTPAEARWNGLAPALAILDKVNPAVANWVRDKHQSGLVLFRDKDQTKGEPVVALCKYDMFRRQIVVNRELFCENDGTVAAILCHEYRHSRQNLGKFCQYVLSFLFVREGDLSIIENDAVIYEQEAHNAVFGNGTSKEKELAAWEHSAQLRSQGGVPGRMSLHCASQALPE
jgi:hypothetical protein